MSIENPTLVHFRHFSSLFTKLPAYKAPDIYVPIRHYICRELSTNQPFLCKTNPILSAVVGLQMNAINSNIITYKKANLALSEVEWANSNPIKPNFKKAKINVNLTLTKDYRKNDDFSVRINKPNFQNGKNDRKLVCYRGL